MPHASEPTEMPTSAQGPEPQFPLSLASTFSDNRSENRVDDDPYSDTETILGDSSEDGHPFIGTVSATNLRYHIYDFHGREFIPGYLLPVDSYQRQLEEDISQAVFETLFGMTRCMMEGINKPHKVMVLGAGYGRYSWENRFGDSHPCTIIQTIDHRPFFVPCFAQNVHPLHDNLNDVWGNFYNGQDFIFTQDTTALFKNWSKLTQESYSSLNMNGVMECQLIDRTINFHSSQGSQEESVTQQYWKNVSLGSRHLGSDPCIATRLPELMIQAGFVDVQVKWRRLPIGDWPTNLKQKTLGLIWRRILVKEMEGAVLKPLIDGLGWSREDVDKAAEDTYRALLACNNISRPYMTAWSVYGRRGIPHTLSSPLQGPESRACSTSPFSLPWLISRFVQRQLQVHEQPRARRRKRKANSRISTKPAKRHRSLGTLAGGMSAPSSRGHARGNTPAIQADDGPPPVDAEQNRHAVERLLDRRIFRLRGRNQQVIRYRVRWEGYGLNDNEWVDEDDIDPPLIQAYEASTRSADGRVGNAMVEEEEDERASDAAELVEDHRNQRSSRTQGRYQWEESDELLSSRAESGITKGQPTPGLVLWKLRPERGYERTAYE